jgi:hypothetical protein
VAGGQAGNYLVVSEGVFACPAPSSFAFEPIDNLRQAFGQGLVGEVLVILPQSGADVREELGVRKRAG